MDGSTAAIDGPPPRGPFAGRWLWVGVVAAVVVGIALIAAILLTARTAALPGGSAVAGNAAVGADTASATLAQLIEEGAALVASTTANQLADPTAYSQLMGAIVIARASLEGTPQAIESARREVVASMDRVSRSLSAKALADAQSDLSAVIGTAVQVNAGAAGRVADDSVRVELQARVEAGWALLSSSANLDAVVQQAQTITDQTTVVLDARFMGFRESDGKWCVTGGKSCVVLAWPAATLASGDRVELAGGEHAVDGSGCYETESFAVGRDKMALLYCPAGESVPDGRRATGANAGDLDRDRLWFSDGSKLSDLRYRT
ncbi:MAG TPA: hypothetical protein VNQ52_12515 [Microbacteriaceae bacterium]|nr:hypothetical protein [Microbacteriaceae bacterium]